MHAFSGGANTEAEHKQFGGNPDKDVPFQYLSFFLEDDAKLEDIRARFRAGTLSSVGIKDELVKVRFCGRCFLPFPIPAPTRPARRHRVAHLSLFHPPSPSPPLPSPTLPPVHRCSSPW